MRNIKGRKGERKMIKRKNDKKRIFSESIPKDLEKELVAEYEKINSDYKTGNSSHQNHGLSVGKFCEIVLRIFENLSNGEYTPIGQRVKSEDIVNKIINSGGHDNSLKKRIAPLIKILLSFRNERGVAHVGNIHLETIDTNFTFYAVRWIYAELIRMYGGMNIQQIQEKIDELGEIIYPDTLKIDGEYVITNPQLTSEQEVIISLKSGPKKLEELFKMNKEKNKTRFKNKLTDMEKRKLIFCDKYGKFCLLPEGKKLS